MPVSYTHLYAQVLFSSYVGDHTLGSKVEGGGDKFFYSITGNAAKKHLYLKLVNAASTDQAVEIEMTGAKVASTAKLVSLSAKDTQATNTLTDPERIVPVQNSLHDVSSHFRHTMPGYSIQVIEFDVQ